MSSLKRETDRPKGDVTGPIVTDQRDVIEAMALAMGQGLSIYWIRQAEVALFAAIAHGYRTPPPPLEGPVFDRMVERAFFAIHDHRAEPSTIELRHMAIALRAALTPEEPA